MLIRELGVIIDIAELADTSHSFHFNINIIVLVLTLADDPELEDYY